MYITFNTHYLAKYVNINLKFTLLFVTCSITQFRLQTSDFRETQHTIAKNCLGVGSGNPLGNTNVISVACEVKSTVL